MIPDAFAIASVHPARGGTIGLCRLPGLYGAIDSDVAAIIAWRPAVVVSLTEAHELAARGAAELGPMLKAQGVAHRYFPIADFATPTVGAPVWEALAADLHHVLNDGKRVLLHCMGGCGRSGMIALRLMVERGEASAPALERLRAARPCAVETGGQMAWANEAIRPTLWRAIQTLPEQDAAPIAEVKAT